jgi:hypothetical protein
MFTLADSTSFYRFLFLTKRGKSGQHRAAPSPKDDLFSRKRENEKVPQRITAGRFRTAGKGENVV